MSDLTQQALAALADAGLGNESAAEAFVIGYQAGWDKAFNLAIRIENELNADEPTDEEIETCARGVLRGHTRPHQLGRRQRSLQTGMAARGQKGARSRQRHENEGTTMNENTTLTDIIDAALAAGCQISVTVTPKDFYEQETEE